MVMARVLQQSLQVGALSKTLAVPPSAQSSALQACSRLTILAQSYLRDFLCSPNYTTSPSRSFLGTRLPSHESQSLAKGFKSSALSSDELQYTIDDETPSSSGFDSDGEEVERVKTDDWRDMLQAKDRKELRAYAHAQKDTIGIHHIGKFGITPNVEISLSDALEKNELIKVKVLSNSPEELSEIAKQLETALRCVCAGQIGRVLILYRPSKKKLEKKKAQEAAAAMSAKRSSFGGGRGRGGFRGGRSGRGGRMGRSSPSFERESGLSDFSSSRQRGVDIEMLTMMVGTTEQTSLFECFRK